MARKLAKTTGKRHQAIARRKQKRKVAARRKQVAKKKVAKKQVAKKQAVQKAAAQQLNAKTAKKTAPEKHAAPKSTSPKSTPQNIVLPAAAKSPPPTAASTKPEAPSLVIPSVVYQPDANTCQSACIAKVLGTEDVYSVRADLEALGEPGDPAVMGQYLKPRVKFYEFLRNGSLNDAKMALDKGCTVITHGWFTHAGHVISLVGYEPDPQTGSYRLIVDDPWGEFDFAAAVYDTSASGDDLRYSSYGIYAFCVGSHSFEQAMDLYAKKVLDSKEKNAWLHLVKN